MNRSIYQHHSIPERRSHRIPVRQIAVLIVLLTASLSPLVSQQIVWEQRYPDPSSDPQVSRPHYEGLDFIRTSDDGFLIWSITGGGLTSAVLRTDSRGKRLWERTFGDLDSGYSVVRYATQIGDSIKVAARWSPRLITTFGNYQQFILNDKGILLDSFLSRDYTHQGGSYIMDGSGNVCDATPEGDMMMTSTSEALGIIFRRIDPHGYERSYTWYHRGDTPTYDYRGTALRRTHDNGFVLVGDRIGPGTLRRPFVVRVDSAGELLWERILYSDSSAPYVAAGGVAVTANNGFCIPTRPYAHLTDDRWKAGCVLVRLDSGGNTLWSREIVTDSSYTYLRSMEQLPDGGYVAVGEIGALLGTSTAVDPTRIYPLIVRCDSAGRLLWMYAGSGTDIGVLNGVHRLPDGSVLAVGTVNHELAIADIADLPSDVAEAPQRRDGIHVLYDRLRNEIVVGSDDYQTAPTQVWVYDIVGRLVKNYAPGETTASIRLSTSDLPHGIYIVVVASTGKIHSESMILP